MMIHKKAGFQLSVDFIVIIILALFFISLGISFIKSSIEKSQIKLEEAMVAGAPKPHVEIKSPQNNQIFQVGDNVSFEPFVYSLNSKIVGYFWDFDGDGDIDSRDEKTKKPYYEIGDYNVTLKVLNDLGGVGTASVIVRVFTKNKKNSTRYSSDPVFFVPSIPSGSSLIKIENWQEILKVIPLTRWNDIEGDHKYDFVAIAKEGGGSIPPDDVKGKLGELGNKTNAVVFDDGVDEDGDYNITYENLDFENYFSYWQDDYDNVVLVDSNNFDGALIAALFAAYSNSPLVFIKDKGLGLEGEYSDYDGYIVGKKFYVIDELPDNVTKHYFGCVAAEEDCGGGLGWGARITDSVFYDSEKLRKGNVTRIIELRSKVFVKEAVE